MAQGLGRHDVELHVVAAEWITAVGPRFCPWAGEIPSESGAPALRPSGVARADIVGGSKEALQSMAKQTRGEGAHDPLGEDVFSYRATRAGLVFIAWHGRTVTTLRGQAAESFLRRIDGATGRAAQLVMAKATGHFKHGTER